MADTVERGLGGDSGVRELGKVSLKRDVVPGAPNQARGAYGRAKIGINVHLTFSPLQRFTVARVA
jgi:hypothetical protein